VIGPFMVAPPPHLTPRLLALGSPGASRAGQVFCLLGEKSFPGEARFLPRALALAVAAWHALFLSAWLKQFHGPRVTTCKGRHRWPSASDHAVLNGGGSPPWPSGVRSVRRRAAHGWAQFGTRSARGVTRPVTPLPRHSAMNKTFASFIRMRRRVGVARTLVGI